MTRTDMGDILTQADIRITEASQLFRVAKSTVYRWIAGETNPKQMMTYEVAGRLCDFIKDATASGYLPVRDVKGKARLGAIKAAIKQVAVDRQLTLGAQ